MISPATTSDAGGVLPQSYGFKETFVEKESYSNENGKVSYHYESHYEITSYRVSIGEKPASESLVYNQSGSLNIISSSDSAATPSDTTVDDGAAADAVAASAPISDNPNLLEGAKNILEFIEQRMIKEQASGATAEKLGEIAKQGFEGFKQGFFEAKEILEDSGQLNDDVQETLNIMYNQVLDGYFSLKDKYVYGQEGASENTIGSTEQAAEEVSLPTATESVSESTSQSSASPGLSPLGSIVSAEPVAAPPRQLLSSNSQIESYNEKFKVLGNASRESLSSMIDSIGDVSGAAKAEVEYGRLDRFAFELTTLDGDKVSINATNMSVFAGRLDGGVDTEDVGVITGLKETSEFAFNVEGELDEQEMAAIEDLLNQIMSLADEFYNGDIDKAYEVAMDMGYNQNEIASYSLKLRQTEQFSATAVYQNLAPVAETSETPATDALSKIGDYAQSVLDTLKNPENYAVFDYAQLLSGLSEQIDEHIKESSRPGFSEVIKDLIDQMPPVEAPFGKVSDVKTRDSVA
jgi:hypothetical protein